MDAVVATMATHSAVALMGPAERGPHPGHHPRYLAGRPETAAGPFRLPSVTCVMRAVRQG